ncbi:hypothetical protein C8A05DRAFT_38055 [Staphylotrichum tortipilum]|uniref:Epidermal growth factor receptor-like transmembrane-juxtamembrane segment domain-containing protein n=1 Tax=Staphylotrichum tortipilum TaxID=2831512 RepID=A0AAN6MDA7_9PEZI|nr:hypothetical protein C8A05DRAFT_38055 [Staphylotrichum longicolle]
MTMTSMTLPRLVALAACLPAASAAMGREQPRLAGPLPTPAPVVRDLGTMELTPRIVTARPHARNLIQKRDTNTCGYLDGDESSSYVCKAPEAQCLSNSAAGAVGCCLTTDCNIYTACLPYASSRATATLDMDRTRYCSESDYPYCAVLRYADPTNSLSGFTIPTCDTVSTTYSFFFKALTASSETTREPSTTGRTTQTSSTAATSSTVAPPPPAGSSTPIGPIVGGVVGGIAGLALLGLGIFFLMRRNKQPSPPAPAAAAAAIPPAPYPPTQPPMGMAPGPPSTFDPAYSMSAKPPALYGGVPLTPGAVSPGGSPPPVYQPQMQAMGVVPGMGMGTPPPHGMGMATPPPQHMMATPPPQHGMGTPPPQQGGYYAPYPGQQQAPQGYPQQQPAAVELPTQRGDGQVHELS